MELWDIYDENKERTGRTMKHNDWNMKPGEFHLTVLGVLMRPDGNMIQLCFSGKVIGLLENEEILSIFEFR